MNLIQTLTTPNEQITWIMRIPFTFLETFIYYMFFSHILEIPEYSFKKVTIFVTSFSLVGLIINMFMPYFSIVHPILFLLILHFYFKQDLKKSFLGLILTYASFYVASCIIELLMRSIFKVTVTDIMIIPLYFFLITILVLALGYSFCYIKNLKNISQKILSKIPLKNIVITNFIFGLIAIFIQSNLLARYKNSVPSSLIIINISSLIIYFSISIYGLIRTSQLEQTKSELETEKIYNKTLSLLHDNIRCFKHDFNNIVQSIGGYIALNDMEGLKKYYSNLLEDCKETNNLNLLNPETINNPSIYSLLTNKYFLATEKGIKMKFNVFTDLSNINFNIYELTRILGILLDNAIEAAELTDEKLIEIELKSTEKKQLFIITNSCIDDKISTTKIFEKGYSTKERNSGIGLWKVHKILSKNENLDLFTTVSNHKFTQQLEIFYDN